LIKNYYRAVEQSKGKTGLLQNSCIINKFKLFLLATLLILSFSAVTQANEFSPEERQILLIHARGCLASNLAGIPAPPPPPGIPVVQRACFVTFFIGRQVIACFGSFIPRRSTLADEICENIRLALKNDPRAVRMTPKLTDSVEIQITFPYTPKRIEDWRQINPKHEGLLVETADGRGVAIVPGEARTANYAWQSALGRLGISSQTAGTHLYRFSAIVVRTAVKERL